MDEHKENKPKSYEEYWQESRTKDEEQRKRMEDTRQQTIKRLQTDPAIQEYLQQFSKYSTDDFINGYATSKASFMEFAHLYESIAEEQFMEYIGRAENCLREIQYKKLFDLACQWSANLITIKEVEVSWDFFAWSSNVLNCPFLPSIQQDEFDLYLSYARSDFFEYYDYFDWLSISDFRSETWEDESGELTPWFEYHNLHTGAGKFLQLADTRGEKENFYRKLWHKEQEEETEKKLASGKIKKNEPDSRPSIKDNDYEQVKAFMKQFEDSATIHLFESYHEYGGGAMLPKDDEEEENSELNERAEDIIDALHTLKDVKLAVEANDDWRVALIQSWEKFEKQQTIHALSAVYDNYLFRVENGIQFETPDHFADNQKLATAVKQQVLRGRELNGEKGNLDF